MLHHRRSWVSGTIAILVALVLAPGAPASGPPSTGAPGEKAKERAYGKHCGPKRRGLGRSSARAKCLDAMAKLDRGATSSPRNACRGLSRKRAKSERRSAFARCVSEGAKLKKAKKRGHGDSGSGSGDGDDEADDVPADDGEPAGDPNGGKPGDGDEPAAELGTDAAGDPDDEDADFSV